ncbi:hyccin isoform X2 [Lutzomyia longipalpis]|uniref:hyccin isoform X2 n=1 Tax=Lutzomyia longipalpis TaxID=7200 RepID=UPI002483ABB0|nr:hyccin isoform X2 [Lutzomyia longipalpis]
MAESLVTDWIADYTSLEDPSEIRTFAAQHEHNHEIASALFTILNERHKYSDLLHSICNQFYSFYKSNETELRRFTLQFVPILIYNYLNAVSQGDKKSCRSIEMLLIVIYNIEISNEDGQPRVVSFRMPVLAQASIYHEEKSLHATDLRRWEENCNRDVAWGPMPEVEHLNAQNRLKVMTALMFVYNQQLSQIQKPALYHLCRTATQLVNQGFTRIGSGHRANCGPTDPNAGMASRPLPRIPVSASFLLELLQAVYFAMFNEFASVAIQTIDDIHNRACYEMFPETILVTNAVRNSLHVNPSGQPSDGPMGISVALTPSTTTVTVSKSMITNASFRAKKLPDDLEMVEDLMVAPCQPTRGFQPTQPQGDNVPYDANASPKGMRKASTKLWRNWGWKYSPSGGKSMSIEEEPESPKKSASSSRHSSPKDSPSRTRNGSPSASPIRRKKTPSPRDSPTRRAEIRASAGARLYQAIEDRNQLFDDSGDEMQALIDSVHNLKHTVRPASVHVGQSNSGLLK